MTMGSRTHKPLTLSLTALLIAWQVFYSYGSEKPFEHIRKHLQEEREKEQKEKGIRDSVKLVWVLHADRDRDKEESEEEDDEEVCVCITQAPKHSASNLSKQANQQPL